MENINEYLCDLNQIYDLADLVEIDEAGGVESETSFGDAIVIKFRKPLCYRLLNKKHRVIIPLHIYQYIDGFQSGYSRVCCYNVQNQRKQWGIINAEGETIVPLEYDYIGDFFSKHISFTILKQDENTLYLDLKTMRIDNKCPDGIKNIFLNDIYPDELKTHKSSAVYETYDSSPTFDEGYCKAHYGEYAGSYAQDEMGFSDDVIDDAFDGDPDACWNID